MLSYFYKTKDRCPQRWAVRNWPLFRFFTFSILALLHPHTLVHFPVVFFVFPSEGLFIIIFMIFICPPSIGEVGTATHYCLHQVIFPGLIYNPFGPRIRRPHCLELTIIAEKPNKRNRSARCMASLEQAERWLGYTKSPPYVVPRIGGCYGRAFDKRN